MIKRNIWEDTKLIANTFVRFSYLSSEEGTRKIDEMEVSSNQIYTS